MSEHFTFVKWGMFRIYLDLRRFISESALGRMFSHQRSERSTHLTEQKTLSLRVF